jgi:molybdopterin-guanine dinucleotide biosynthesis protein A
VTDGSVVTVGSVVTRRPEFDAIVLAGGNSARLGGVDKAMVSVAGRPLLRHVLDAVDGATRRIVAGPRRDVSLDVTWCREEPPGGGPVAGLSAALPLTAAPTVLVVATDLPGIGHVVKALLAAVRPGRVAVLSDGDGRAHFDAAAWPRRLLAERLSARPAENRSLRSLYEGLDVETIVDSSDAAADCDTWDDIRGARRRLEPS